MEMKVNVIIKGTLEVDPEEVALTEDDAAVEVASAVESEFYSDNSDFAVSDLEDLDVSVVPAD